jgi:hypothetical protein
MEEGIKIELPQTHEKNHSTGLAETVLEKLNDITQHLDHQANILIGVSSGIFVFSAAGYEKEHSLALLIMTVFAGVAALVGLLAIHPPRSMRKRGQTESLLYNKKIAGYSSAEAYAKDLKKASHSSEQTFEQYTIEVYNLCKYYYRPKRKLFHLAREIFFVGIIFSLTVFLIQL